jgi:plasmid stabilization system protein ParE
MDVTWSPKARLSHARIYQYIFQTNPHEAMRVGRRILAGGNALALTLTGRMGRTPRTYEKSLTDINYILQYRLRRGGQEVVILDVIHSRRNWPAGEPPPA